MDPENPGIPDFFSRDEEDDDVSDNDLDDEEEEGKTGSCLSGHEWGYTTAH